MTIKGGSEAAPESKATMVQQMLSGTLPEMAAHTFTLQTNYLVCSSCNLRALRNSAKDKLPLIASQPCWNQAWQPDASWQGHSTHDLWRRGGRVFCCKCQAHGVAQGGETWKPSRAITKRCGGEGGQQRLPDIFKAETAARAGGAKETRKKTAHTACRCRACYWGS